MAKVCCRAIVGLFYNIFPTVLGHILYCFGTWLGRLNVRGSRFTCFDQKTFFLWSWFISSAIFTFTNGRFHNLTLSLSFSHAFSLAKNKAIALENICLGNTHWISHLNFKTHFVRFLSQKWNFFRTGWRTVWPDWTILKVLGNKCSLKCSPIFN